MNYKFPQSLSAFFFVFIILLLPKAVYADEVRGVPDRQVKKWYQQNAKSGPVQLIISIPDQKMSVYQNGEHIIETRISSGRPGHNTPAGVFSVLGKRREHYSNLYDDAPMPFMQRLTWSGIALHAGNVSRRYASHGCVRMPYNFASKLFRYTRRGVHVIIANEQVRPVEISHKNLIAPTPRLVPVPRAGSSGTAMGLTTQAFASSQSNEKDGGIVGYKRVLTEAEARLEQLKSDIKKNKIDLAATRELIKQQKLAVKAGWIAYRKQKTKTARLDYRYSRLLKQVGRSENSLAYVKRTTKAKLAKALKWQDITERKQARLHTGLVKINAELTALKQQQDEDTAAGKNVSKLKKKIARLKRKRSRLLKQISWAENNSAKAGKYAEAQKTKADAGIEKASRQLLKHKEALAAFNVKYLPLKQKRVEAKKAYDKALAEAKLTMTSFRMLQRNQVRLKNGISTARKTVRVQKKPLRILLTRSTRRHKVRDIQQALNDLGYGLDKIDGLYGQETISVIRQYQKANNLKASGLINDKLIGSIREKLGREPLNVGHIYVRQGFRDIFDAPVNISDPERKLGTHFYTAMKFDKKDSQARWNVVTIKNRKQIARIKSGKQSIAPKVSEQQPPNTAKEALDRITMPEKVRSFLSKRLTSGTSLIITDNGYSDETGKGTDFIVLAR